MSLVRPDCTRLIERLPPVRGRLTENAPLGAMTWFRVGGNAEVLFKPADLDDLRTFLGALDASIPVTVLGVASNMIVRDGGIPGVVIRMGRDAADIRTEGDRVIAGASALDANVAEVAAQAGLGGLEFLSGIPGTVGGALRMNAGAYGTETRDVLISCRALDRKGNLHTFDVADMQMEYRRNSLGADYIFVDAMFQAHAEDAELIRVRMDDIKNKRNATQPVRAATGGSTFANPEGMKAWELIDKAGCRGLTVGGAMMSDLHCNFMINTGDATAADLERLGETVRARVYDDSGVMLRWEIKRIGVPLQQDTDIAAYMTGETP